MTRHIAILTRFFLSLALAAACIGSSAFAQIPRCRIRDFTPSIGSSESATRSDVTTEILLRYNGRIACRATGFPQLRLAQSPRTTFTVNRQNQVTEHILPRSKNSSRFILLKKNHVSAETYPLATPKGSFGKTYILHPHSTIAFNLETPETPCDGPQCGPQDCEPVDMVLIGPFQQVHESPKADSLGNHRNDYRELSEVDRKGGNYLLLEQYEAQSCGGATVTSLYQP